MTSITKRRRSVGFLATTATVIGVALMGADVAGADLDPPGGDPGTGVTTTTSHPAPHEPSSGATTPAAKNGQGGCHTYTVQGYNVGVCVNDRSTGDTAYPDIYVNSKPPTWPGTSCGINLSIWDNHDHRYSAHHEPCDVGHHEGAWSASYDPDHDTALHAYARLDLAGNSYPIGDSPPITLNGSQRYVTLGDSFSSGEGGDVWEPGANEGTGNNNCHRSPNSYAAQLARKPDFPATYHNSMWNLACSGATMAAVDDLSTLPQPYNKPQENATPQELGQLRAIGRNTQLVTMTIGGNDLNFVKILTDCLTGETGKSCKTKWQNDVERKLSTVDKDKQTFIGNALRTVYQDIRTRAPNAHLIVLTYPHILPKKLADPNYYLPCQEQGHGNVTDDDLQWIWESTDRFDQIITDTATKAGATVVDMRPVFVGHEQCTKESWFHPINIPSHKIPGWGVDQQEFHPTVVGYSHEADTLDRQLAHLPTDDPRPELGR